MLPLSVSRSPATPAMQISAPPDATSAGQEQSARSTGQKDTDRLKNPPGSTCQQALLATFQIKNIRQPGVVTNVCKKLSLTGFHEFKQDVRQFSLDEQCKQFVMERKASDVLHELPGRVKQAIMDKHLINKEIPAQQRRRLADRAAEYVGGKPLFFQGDGQDAIFPKHPDLDLNADVVRTEAGFFQILEPMTEDDLRRLSTTYPVLGKRGHGLLGKGSFGEVRVAASLPRSSEGSDFVAVKITDDDEVSKAEAATVKALPRSKNFSQLRVSATPVKNGKAYLFQDLLGHGEIFQMALAIGTLDRTMRKAYVRTVAAKMIATLQELHEAGIYHRDIKPENIMISATANVRLVDFGCATHSREHPPEKESDEPTWGTLKYREPDHPENTALSADLFSLGGTFIVLALQKSLPEKFRGFDENETKNLTGADLLEVGKKLATAQPAARPSLGEVQQMPFFDDELLDDKTFIEVSDDLFKKADEMSKN